MGSASAFTAGEWARRLGWWGADYAYAARRQLLALVVRTEPEAFRSGSHRPVVVLPGIWESWRFMLPLIEKVHAAGHPVFVIPELGRNSSSVDVAAHVVAAFLADRDLREILIIAHSKGGLIGKYVMARLDDERRVAAMVAVSTPFSGSRYASVLVLPSLRALSPRDETIRMLGRGRAVNADIVSVFAAFDPHIPEGSELDGATNLRLPTGGHFRTLAQPETIAAVLERAAPPAPTSAGLG